MSQNVFLILFTLGVTILIFLVFLIVMIGHETKHGKIIVGLNQDHICEHCGDQINIEHPCYCNNCWNKFRNKNKQKCDHKDGELAVFDESDNLRKICAHCGYILK